MLTIFSHCSKNLRGWQRSLRHGTFSSMRQLHRISGTAGPPVQAQIAKPSTDFGSTPTLLGSFFKELDLGALLQGKFDRVVAGEAGSAVAVLIRMDGREEPVEGEVL